MGWYTYDVHENCPIFKTTPTPTLLVHLRPKVFHPLDLGRPTFNFKRTPPLQMITSQLKESIIQRWLLYVIRSFLQVDFRCQYQLINCVWLSFDFFSFSWSLTICFFVALYSFVCSFPKISRNFFIYNYSHFSTHFSINSFYLHNLKT